MKILLKIIKNNSGTVMPASLLLCLLTLSFATIHVANIFTDLQNLKFRNKSYLCTQYVIREIESYYKYQSFLNRLVQTGYWLMQSPEPYSNSTGRIMHKTSQILQNIYHISYLKNLTLNTKCSWKETSLLTINTPVEQESKIYLKRNFDGSLTFKESWKTNLIYMAPKNLNKMRFSFSIELNFELVKGVIFHNFKLNSKEINSEALWKLKRLVGRL